MSPPVPGKVCRPMFAIGLAAFVVLISATGCDDDNITITKPGNRPPQILLSGPEYDDSEPLEAPLPMPWVVVADADGEADIAAVVLRISNARLVSVIVRPDDFQEECRKPFYADMDTIDIGHFLEKTEFRVSDQLLWKGTNGAYQAYLGYNVLTENGLGAHGNVFGPSVKDCRWGLDYLYMIEEFGLYPPALSAPRDVYVTYAEFVVSGISITAYDQSGASVTESFPDFRGYFTNDLEERTLP
jgi:hypothetical protein